jgi:predicted transcriptional regulator of viral defense system
LAKVKIDAFFYTHPVFRHAEFVHWKAEQGAVNPRAAHKALLYYVKSGRILSVRRGVYAVIQPNVMPDQVSVDPYLLASKASNDSVLAYHTALELHGVAYSVFEQFTFLTSQKIKPFDYQGQWFQSVAFPLALKRLGDKDYGIEKLDRQGMTIQVTNLARTFVDVIDRVELSGGWEEVFRSISNMAVLDVNDVINYCLKLNSRILAAKVGFFLEQRQGAFAVSDEVLKPLLEKKPATPQSLVKHDREGGQLVKKWNLILPLYVLKRSWEEPDHDV